MVAIKRKDRNKAPCSTCGRRALATMKQQQADSASAGEAQLQRVEERNGGGKGQGQGGDGGKKGAGQSYQGRCWRCGRVGRRAGKCTQWGALKKCETGRRHTEWAQENDAPRALKNPVKVIQSELSDGLKFGVEQVVGRVNVDSAQVDRSSKIGAEPVDGRKDGPTLPWKRLLNQ